MRVNVHQNRTATASPELEAVTEVEERRLNVDEENEDDNQGEICEGIKGGVGIAGLLQRMHACRVETRTGRPKTPHLAGKVS